MRTVEKVNRSASDRYVVREGHDDTPTAAGALDAYVTELYDVGGGEYLLYCWLCRSRTCPHVNDVLTYRRSAGLSGTD